MVTIGPSDTQWPGIGRDFHHTGFVDSALTVGDNSTNWVSGNVGFYQGTALAVAASMVFVTCNNGSWSGITALQLVSGDVVWQAALDNIGYWESRASCAYLDGNLYVTTYMNLVKLDAATGTQLDIYDFGELLVNSDVMVADGKVFIGSFEFMGNGFYAAVDASDFTLLWKKEYPGLNCNAVPAYDAGMLYVGTAPSFGSPENAAMMALNAETGERAWKEDSPNGFSYYAPMTVHGDFVYGATFSFNEGDNTTITKRNKTDGTLEWVRECGSASAPPVVTDDLVVVAGGSHGPTDGRTTCYDLAGGLEWDETTTGSWTCQPVVFGSCVFTSDFYYDSVNWVGWNTTFHCLDITDGTKLWSYDGCGGSPSVVIVGGTVYVIVGSHDGQIYCFGG
jgi:outer membrane protein assembly factor BamB